MTRSRLQFRSILRLLFVALFAMHLGGGAHLHLCFDGNGEPPASVHLTYDGAHHAGQGADGVHHDADVSLASDALLKKFDGFVKHPGLLAAAYVLFTQEADPVVAVPRAYVTPFEPFPAFRRLPPLRGPPV